MKKIGVIVKDKNTLVLDEDGSKGDWIDLTALCAIDTSGIEQSISSGADKVYSQRLSQERGRFELEKRNEITELQGKIRQMQAEAAAEASEKRREMESAFNAKIAELKGRLEAYESEKKAAVGEAVAKKDEELAKQRQESMAESARLRLEAERLRAQIENEKNQAQIHENDMKENFENQLRAKDEQIVYYKDLKARLSTKMVGETLEVHCRTMFEQFARPLMPEAYFEKDNDVRPSGSKGDFIFRDYVDGVEYVSIMFEMKNEADDSTKRHKNEDFFKELDKDRREKQCEFAVLVSLLEGDSDLYNGGIVDVSHKFDKMYVIRPQFFIPIITLLRNASRKSLDYKRQLSEARNQSIDITNFEEELNAFKKDFGRNYRLASEKFNDAVAEIDKSIAHLQKIKDALIGSENNLRIANGKADDLSIKRLTRNNPTMRGLFERAAAKKDAAGDNAVGKGAEGSE